MPWLLILGAALPLGGALISQFGFGLHPCHFCLLQRYPYLVVIAAGALMFTVQRGGIPYRILLALAIYALFATAMLGLIHTGIENGLINYTGGCVAEIKPGATPEEIRAAILAAPLVACNDVVASFMGLSMASWNVIYALALIILIIRKHRNMGAA